MTRDDIIRMAREAGFQVRLNEDGSVLYIANLYDTEDCEAPLMRFAALVAAAEREACAISCEVNAARWIDAGGKQWYAAHECAAAIRARTTS